MNYKINDILYEFKDNHFYKIVNINIDENFVYDLALEFKNKKNEMMIALILKITIHDMANSFVNLGSVNEM